VKDYLKQTAAQLTGILIAAIGAGAIAFGQSLLAVNGACPAPVLTPVETGLLGGAIKTALSAISLSGRA
jgi:hypothetical protein